MQPYIASPYRWQASQLPVEALLDHADRWGDSWSCRADRVEDEQPASPRRIRSSSWNWICKCISHGLHNVPSKTCCQPSYHGATSSALLTWSCHHETGHLTSATRQPRLRWWQSHARSSPVWGAEYNKGRHKHSGAPLTCGDRVGHDLIQSAFQGATESHVLAALERDSLGQGRACIGFSVSRRVKKKDDGGRNLSAVLQFK